MKAYTQCFIYRCTPHSCEQLTHQIWLDFVQWCGRRYRDGRTNGGDCNIPIVFLESVGIIKYYTFLVIELDRPGDSALPELFCLSSSLCATMKSCTWMFNTLTWGLSTDISMPRNVLISSLTLSLELILKQILKTCICKYEYSETWIKNLFQVSGVHIATSYSDLYFASLFILYFIIN